MTTGTTGMTGPEGPALKTFYVKSRRKSPILYSTVEADTRDTAVHMVIAACPPEEEIEVMQVEETAYPEGPPAAGAMGASGPTGPASRHK